MRRIPELDALRGLAALAILTFHLNPPAFPLGWTGVDLFFVLSGYLITGIILRHGGTKGFLSRFYARRGLRIWPIYYLTLLLLVAINPYLPRPESLKAVPYYLTYTQNLPAYWTYRAPSMPAFDHTWTLALEEQFYLIWPAMILLIGPKRVVPTCVAVIALGASAREPGMISWSPFSERILLARCDGFALGGLLAALETRLEPRRFSAVSAGALALSSAYMAWGYFSLSPPRGSFFGLPTPARPSLTILAVGVFYFGVVGLVTANAGRRGLAPLRSRALGYLGRISYGLYLYHVPIFWLIDDGRIPYEVPWSTRLVKVGITLAAAVATWHLIEAPILRLKDRFSYREPAQDEAASRLTPPRGAS